MEALVVQTKQYVDLPKDVILKFNSEDRLDAFSVDVRSKVTDPNEPSEFKRL